MLCHFTLIFIVSLVSYLTRHAEHILHRSSTIIPLQEKTTTLASSINNNTNNQADNFLFRILSNFQEMNLSFVNIISEILLILLIILYLQSAFFRTLRVGNSSFYEILLKTLTRSPEMSLFVLASIMIIFSIPLVRLNPQFKLVEDSLTAFVMFALPLKFLFFCRAFRSVGPFVIMIYKIVVNDLLCFVIIMLIFVFGFSQSFGIIFKSHQSHFQTSLQTMPDTQNSHHLIQQYNNNSTINSDVIDKQVIPTTNNLTKNYFDDSLDGILSMHLMALNEFGMVFDEFESTDFPNISKLLFLIYMILASILLVNLLIAMLGKTYQEIASQPNENLRQWASTLLMVERSWKDTDKLSSLQKYSQEKVVQIASANKKGQVSIVESKQRFYQTTLTLGVSECVCIYIS